MTHRKRPQSNDANAESFYKRLLEYETRISGNSNLSEEERERLLEKLDEWSTHFHELDGSFEP